MPGRILIVDDIPTNRILLRVRLIAAYYEVTQASSAAEALESMVQNQPDLVLINARLGEHDTLDLCRKITVTVQASAETCAIIAPTDSPYIPPSGETDGFRAGPSVFIYSSQADERLRLDALQAGAEDVLIFPQDDVLLQARVRSLMRAGDTVQETHIRGETHRMLGLAEPVAAFASPPRICVLSDRQDADLHWLKGLRQQDIGQISCHESRYFLRDICIGAPPDLCLIHLTRPHAAPGLRLLSALRAHPETRHAAVLVILPDHDPNLAADALDLGAGDVMTGYVGPAELAFRVRSLIRRKGMADQLRSTLRNGLRAAVTDPLTGLYNRRYAIPHLTRMADHAARSGRHFAVMLADLDHFKAINDRYGHAAGDAVLVEVAQRLRANLRAVDLIARIGGEEFLIALPDTGRGEARVAARRLCRIMSQDPFALPGTDICVNVTLSIGVTMGTRPFNTAGNLAMDQVQSLLHQADKALYGAKSCGRNQVTISSPAA